MKKILIILLFIEAVIISAPKPAYMGAYTATDTLKVKKLVVSQYESSLLLVVNDTITCDSIKVNGSWISPFRLGLKLNKADTLNKWLPKTGKAANSNLFKGKDTTYFEPIWKLKNDTNLIHNQLTNKVSKSDTVGTGAKYVTRNALMEAIANISTTVYASTGVRKDGDTIKLGDKDMYDKYRYIVIPVDTSLIISDTSFLGINITIQNKPFASRSISISAPDSIGTTSGFILLSPQVADIAIKQMDFKIDSLGAYNRYRSVPVTTCDTLGNFEAEGNMIADTFKGVFDGDPVINRKNLDNGTTTPILKDSVGADSCISATIEYTLFCFKSGTGRQLIKNKLDYVYVKYNGTWSGSLNAYGDDERSVKSSGTFVPVWTVTQTNAGVTLNLNATSSFSLSAGGVKFEYQILNHTRGTITKY